MSGGDGKEGWLVASGAVPAQGVQFVGNKTIGRLKTLTGAFGGSAPDMVSPAERLTNLRAEYRDHASGRATLLPRESLALRSEIDRLSAIVEPGVSNAWPAFNASETAYMEARALEHRKVANTLGMQIGGAASALPAVARAFGAPEEIVEKFAEIGADLVGTGIGSVSGLAVRKIASTVRKNAGSRTQPSGTFVQQVKSVKPPPDGYKTYVTHGITTPARKTVEGRRMVHEFRKLGYTDSEAVDMTELLLKTSSTLPQANPVERGDKFAKIVPRGTTPGPASMYWAPLAELEELLKLGRDKVFAKLGVPLESQQGSEFDIVVIEATRPTMSFISEIAPTTQNGYPQSGGAIQVFPIDRSAYTPPKVMRKLP
ncbi:MAG TPA: hypothetical protein VIT92_00440 [Burkholderiaceae bacterium]